jgi:type IV pilus assembly protein PilF
MKIPSRNLIPGLLVLMLSACSTTSASKKAATVEGMLNVAGAAINEGDHITALEYLSQAQGLEPDNARAHHLYALAYLGKREYKLAEESARQSVRLDPKLSAARNTLGKILMDLGKFNEAETLFKQAANDLLNREADRAKLNLGILYTKTLKPDLAEQWFKLALEDRTPIACLAHFQLGKISLEKNDLPKAERHYRLSAKGVCSGMSETHLAIAQVLSRQKRYEEARAKFVEIQRIFVGTEASDKAIEYLRDLP